MKLFLIVLLLYSNITEPNSIRNSDQDIDEAALFDDWLLDIEDDQDEELLFYDWLVDDVDKDELLELPEGIDDFSKKTSAARLSINRWFDIYFGLIKPLDELVL